jgi:hypothetical protein
VQEHEFPRTARRREQLRFLVQYAVLAPSGHNTQPWRFVIDDDAVHIHVDRGRELSALDPGGRELLMSCGAALFHLRTAAHHYGYAPVVRTWPRQAAGEDREDGERIATFRLGPACEASLREHRLFSAILRRRTHRGAFDDRPVPSAEVDRLRRAAEKEGAHLDVVADADRDALARLVTEADHVLASDPDVRREWAEWGVAAGEDRDDGIPNEARGWSLLRAHAAPYLVHLPGGFAKIAGETADRVRTAPLLLVLSTLDDSKSAWLEAGQALDRVLLKATSFGLYASFLNHPLKVAWLRPQVADLLCPDRYPQAILRVGFSADPPTATPRRPAESVTED